VSFFFHSGHHAQCIHLILISNSIFMPSSQKSITTNSLTPSSFHNSLAMGRIILRPWVSYVGFIREGLLFQTWWTTMTNSDSRVIEKFRVASAKLRRRQKSEELDATTDPSWCLEFKWIPSRRVQCTREKFLSRWSVNVTDIRPAKFNGVAWTGKFMRGKCVGDKFLSRAKLWALCS